jgi:UDP-N-acetylmuramate--alanine ligase
LSFGDVGEYDPNSQFFIYEADEYDRNFLSFYPELSLISGIDYDHPDIYPTRESYEEAFLEFFEQSNKVVIWHDDAERMGIEADLKYTILDRGDPAIESLKLPGLVNRQNAWLVADGLAKTLNKTPEDLIEILRKFPGVSRRFEQLAPNIYSDSAHTPPKIRGAMQMAHEVAGNNVAVVYEGLHNTRQHFIKNELADLFDGIKKLYVIPTYLAREDKNLELLTPEKILNLLSSSTKSHAQTAKLNAELLSKIKDHASQGDLVLCLSAGGAGSLDEWLRKQFSD